MLELLKQNLSKVITFVQEKYGELSQEEVSLIQEEPNKIYSVLEEKFGLNKEEVEEYLSTLTEKINLEEHDETIDRVGATLEQGKNLFGGYDQKL